MKRQRPWVRFAARPKHPFGSFRKTHNALNGFSQSRECEAGLLKTRIVKALASHRIRCASVSYWLPLPAGRGLG